MNSAKRLRVREVFRAGELFLSKPSCTTTTLVASFCGRQRQHRHGLCFSFLGQQFWDASSSLGKKRLRSFSTPAATTTVNTADNCSCEDTNDTTTTSGPVTEALRKRIRLGTIREDKDQYEVANRLDRLYADLVAATTLREKLSRRVLAEAMRREDTASYSETTNGPWNRMSRKHPKHRRTSIPKTTHEETTKTRTTGTNDILQRISRSASRAVRSSLLWALHQPAQGLYLHGSVGIGKSFLMDLFHDQLISSGIPSRRVHFHEFMLDVHQRIHRVKQDDPKKDALPAVALQLSRESKVLCFDEFQVTDIADAMILKRLFEILFGWGVVVVATSNRPPSRLYEGGLNRARFLPFVATLCKYCAVVALDTQHDYRKDDTVDTAAEASAPSYFLSSSSSSPETQSALDALFGGDAESGVPETLEVRMGRTIRGQTSWIDSMCGRFAFDELCGNPLGASDYLALAERYETIILEDVPILDARKYNEARRFVTFVDACYEARVRLVVSAEVPLEHLFVEFEATVETHDGDEETQTLDAAEEIQVLGEGGSSSSSSTTTIRSSGDNIEWSATGRIGVSLAQLSSVQEVVFSFRRAESRLYELCRHWNDTE